MNTKQNIKDFKDIQKKRQRSAFYNLLHPKKLKRFKEKISRIPQSFLDIFDQQSYLYANPDIKKSLEAEEFQSGLEHFVLFGYDEVKQGKRRLGTLFPFMNEEEYLSANPDIKKAHEEGSLPSIFGHFIHWGYKEVLEGNRNLAGEYPFKLSDEIIEIIKDDFSEELYLNLHSDVSEAVAKKDILSGWDHFISLGLNEIRKGERTLHPDLPPISEIEYVQFNDDIFEALKNNHLDSPFIHFLTIGQHEILSGKRIMPGKNTYIFRPSELSDLIAQEIEEFEFKPLISVVMPVYNVDAQWLELAIDSLKKQWYPHWEICIADDKSTKQETVDYLKSLDHPKVKIVFLDKNVNISGASNAALNLAEGKYIALMDNDDELTSDALYEVVKAINAQGSEFIYSDEDKLEMDGRHTDPHFKSDFSPDMFLSQNYLSHLGVIKKSLIDKVGGWEIGLEGAQDYDLYLKVLEHTDKVTHIPKVLYHWRKIPGSTADEFSEKSYAQEAGLKALQNAIQRRGIKADAFNGKYPGTYRVRYEIICEPLVSIIIPFKDKPELLDMCINSILDKSTYQNYEIIGMSNNSEEKETFEMMKALEDKDNRVKFYEYNHPFNYSAINNHAVRHYAKGEQLILLNNDIEIISPEWIESMLEFSQREDVGAVGVKLYYPNDTLQHAGVIVGLGGVAGHSHKHFPHDSGGYFFRAHIVQNLLAVTAACLMVKKSIYLEVKGLNEDDLKIAFNDVDFCLRIYKAGYLNVYTPYCEAYHHESISRGAEDNPEKIARFNKEVEHMKKRHQSILLQGDPYYNINLTLDYENFGIK